MGKHGYGDAGQRNGELRLYSRLRHAFDANTFQVLSSRA